MHHQPITAGYYNQRWRTSARTTSCSGMSKVDTSPLRRLQSLSSRSTPLSRSPTFRTPPNPHRYSLFSSTSAPSPLRTLPLCIYRLLPSVSSPGCFPHFSTTHFPCFISVSGHPPTCSSCTSPSATSVSPEYSTCSTILCFLKYF